MPKLPKDYLKTHSNRFLRMVSKAREADKIVNTFIEGLKGYIHNGRIHADINQIRSDQGGTVTGRFSMSNPNLQQIPAKGYIGKKMREVFLPEEGYKWGSFDYSQQEPRIVVHYAVKHNLSKTSELRDKFNSDEADFHRIVATMANIPRKQAKTVTKSKASPCPTLTELKRVSIKIPAIAHMIPENTYISVRVLLV